MDEPKGLHCYAKRLQGFVAERLDFRFLYDRFFSLQMCVVGFRAFVVIGGISLSLAVWLVVVRDFKKEDEKKVQPQEVVSEAEGH